jgi:hypothetical protein
MDIPEITPELLQIKAAKLKLSRFVSHECGECDFKISYSFSGEEVFFNNACRCENSGGLTTKTSWKTVAEEVKALLQIPSKAEAVKQFWQL